MTSEDTPKTNPPSAFVPALMVFFQSLIETRRAAYHAAEKRIRIDCPLASSGYRRRRVKLALPLQQLQEHMAARDARREAQRELMLVVPLWRKLRAGIQNKDSFDPQTSHVLMAINFVLTKHSMAFDSEANNIEKRLARAIQDAFPNLLPRSVDESKAPASCEKQKLYDRIVRAKLLSSEEVLLLSRIFATTS